MKRYLIVFLAVLFAFGIASARKKDKAGRIENGVYNDNVYGFSMVIPDEWDSSIKKEEDPIRLILTKKQYDIPTQFQYAPNYTKAPKVTVLVDTTSMKLDWFVDSLLNDKYGSKQKKKILQNLEILYGDYVPKKNSKVSFGSTEGILISGERRYTIQVQRAGYESDKADVVTDYFGGSVFFAKKGNQLIMIHFICEKRYFSTLDQVFMKLLNGFTLTK